MGCVGVAWAHSPLLMIVMLYDDISLLHLWLCGYIVPVPSDHGYVFDYVHCVSINIVVDGMVFGIAIGGEIDMVGIVTFY